MKITFISRRIVISTFIIISLFLPLVILRAAPGRVDFGVFEVIANLYVHFISFPFGYIVDYLAKHFSIPNSGDFFLIALLIDCYVNSVIINNVIDFKKKGHF